MTDKQNGSPLSVIVMFAILLTGIWSIVYFFVSKNLALILFVFTVFLGLLFVIFGLYATTNKIGDDNESALKDIKSN